MRFGYRLMRGRQGVSGHARAMGNRTALSARGLTPGEPCVLYALRERGPERLESLIVGQDGRAQFMVQAEEPLFAAQDGRVVLWEDGPDAEAQYLLASAWIGKENKRKSRATDTSAIRRDGEVSPATLAHTPAVHLAAETITSVAVAKETVKAAEPETSVREKRSEQPNGQKRFVLRPAGSGEAADALPILRWPAGTEDLRLNCALRPPFAPFDAPGWRFVQVPSPLPHVPFCAVGYRARDARVKEIAYAIPGPQNRPPVRLAGYHYRPGRRGQGYWVMTKRV